ncbi:MAG: hypothetical protein U0869_25370 [Chloroflexota bacterium]
MDHRRPRVRLPRGRRAVVVVGLAVLTVVLALLPGTGIVARQPAPRDAAADRLGVFLWALAGEESGWDWTARNRSSGAYGRYQVMPDNWPAWADRYLGDRFADPSPHNQAIVVRRKVADLHDWLGSWRRVAYWWLTGDTETDERRWSSVAQGYVDDISALMKRAPDAGEPVPADEGGPDAGRGDWRFVVGDGAGLLDRVEGDKRGVADLRDGQVLFVQDARRNADGVLWLRVSTAGDDIGWISIRRTVPAGRPDDPGRWPRDGRITKPGGPGDGGRDDRARARPRPR